VDWCNTGIGIVIGDRQDEMNSFCEIWTPASI